MFYRGTCNFTAQPIFDTLRGHESRPRCHDTMLRYAVTLQVYTHPHTRRTSKNDCMFSNYCSNHSDMCLRKVYEDVSICLFIYLFMHYLSNYLFMCLFTYFIANSSMGIISLVQRSM
jgi:hypothetical protein